MLRRTWVGLLCVSLCVTLDARQPVKAPHGMVVSQEPRATDVGVNTLKSGGNAVDAAVATAFALAVTHPSAGNLGGGGFMLVRFADGRTTFFDFREKAPAKATHDMYLDASGKATRDSILGPRASGVPGTVRGLEAAHRKFGQKKWAEVVDPSVDLARNGVALSYSEAGSMQGAKNLTQFPESRRIFQHDGQFYQPGDTFKQPELAGALERISRQGSKGFYEGETAAKIADYMAASGGLITREDLKAYNCIERQPLLGKYKGYEVLTSPPPSSGGIGILQMMGMLENSGYEKTGAGSAASIHFVAETMRRYYADRSEYLGDPDFFKVPITQLLDPKYIAGRRASIDLAHASNSTQLGKGDLARHESTETTHISVVDGQGNAVSMTYTLNGGYGSGVTVPGIGMLLNNEMDDFAAKPGEANMFGLVQGESNAIQPGKRPLSSMTPTIISRDGKLFMVVGAPGGSRIITGVMQVILNVLDFGMNVQEAIDAPRFHHQWKPDVLYTEPGVSPDTIAILRAKGHEVSPNTGGVALVEAITINKDGTRNGGYDGRADGKAAGY